MSIVPTFRSVARLRREIETLKRTLAHILRLISRGDEGQALAREIEVLRVELRQKNININALKSQIRTLNATKMELEMEINIVTNQKEKHLDTIMNLENECTNVAAAFDHTARQFVRLERLDRCNFLPNMVVSPTFQSYIDIARPILENQWSSRNPDIEHELINDNDVGFTQQQLDEMDEYAQLMVERERNANRNAYDVDNESDTTTEPYTDPN
jgi:hypothetical protein